MLIATALDLSQANAQDVYDYIVFALIQQGAPSIVKNPGAPALCAYRAATDSELEPGLAPSLLRCGIGYVIPDAEYHPRFEGKSVNSLINESEHDVPTIAKWVDAGAATSSEEVYRRRDLLVEIQKAHDNATHDSSANRVTDEAWLKQFRLNTRATARYFNLDDSITKFREASLPTAVLAPLSVTHGIGPDDEIAGL